MANSAHGGFDGGAVASDGTVEKNINLKICIVLADFLKVNGYEVIMTRSTDVSTDDVETDKIITRKKSDLKNRLKLMQDYPADRFAQQNADEITKKTVEFIKTEPLVKAIIAGHIHLNYRGYLTEHIPQITTSCTDIRIIEID